jgi:hypothetical protein
MTGFHVHFGLPHEILSFSSNKSIQFIRSLVYVLDYFVGIPCMLADDTDYRRLSFGQYGKAGDFRISEYTMEYRTPGGFYLRSPLYSRYLLEASYTVVEDVLNRASVLTKNWTEMDNFCSLEHMRELYDIPERNDVRKVLSSVSRRLAHQKIDSISDRYTRLFGYARSEKFIKGFLSPYPISSVKLLDTWKQKEHQ